MTHWVSWATKVFGYIAQFILRPWLFDAELLGASRTVYTSKSGNSPFVDIGASVRIHNRNNTPTTVFVRSIGVRLAHGMEAGLDRAVMIRPGPISSIEDMAGFNTYEVPGCSSVELSLSVRKYNPADLKEYFEEASPKIELELGETFCNHRKLAGPIKSDARFLPISTACKTAIQCTCSKCNWNIPTSVSGDVPTAA